MEMFFSRVLSDSIGHYVGPSVGPSEITSIFRLFSYVFEHSEHNLALKVEIIKYFHEYSKNFEDFLSS